MSYEGEHRGRERGISVLPAVQPLKCHPDKAGKPAGTHHRQHTQAGFKKHDCRAVTALTGALHNSGRSNQDTERACAWTYVSRRVTVQHALFGPRPTTVSRSDRQAEASLPRGEKLTTFRLVQIYDCVCKQELFKLSFEFLVLWGKI